MVTVPDDIIKENFPNMNRTKSIIMKQSKKNLHFIFLVTGVVFFTACSQTGKTDTSSQTANFETTLVKPVPVADGKIHITLYKNPGCQCCGKWAEYMDSNGFSVEVKKTSDLTAFKETEGVPDNLRSCHTALVNGYVLEGHVPANAVKKLLKEKSAVIGLAVAGMPDGAPGVMGGKRAQYDVFAFTKDGKQTRYGTY